MAHALDGKVALVTGAGKRVGRAIALACARDGAHVAVHYRTSRVDAEQVADEISGLGRRAFAAGADLNDPRQARSLIERTAEQLGGIDLLVNSAATFSRCELLEPDDERWERAWQQSLTTNLIAPARLARYAAPWLKSRSGVIVNVVDVAASLAWPGYAHHCAAKAGLTSLTQTLAIELAPQVRVVGVSPGIALFPEGLPAERQQHYVSQTALDRPGSPEDVAAAVVFLASQSYITGAVLPVDGGWGLRTCR